MRRKITRMAKLEMHLQGGWTIAVRVEEIRPTACDVTMYDLGGTKKYYEEVIGFERAIEFFEDLGYNNLELYDEKRNRVC